MKVMQALILPMSNLEEAEFISESMLTNKDKVSPKELAKLINSILKLTLVDVGSRNAQEMMEALDGEISFKMHDNKMVLTQESMIEFINKKFGDKNEQNKEKH